MAASYKLNTKLLLCYVLRLSPGSARSPPPPLPPLCKYSQLLLKSQWHLDFIFVFLLLLFFVWVFFSRQNIFGRLFSKYAKNVVLCPFPAFLQDAGISQKTTSCLSFLSFSLLWLWHPAFPAGQSGVVGPHTVCASFPGLFLLARRAKKAKNVSCLSTRVSGRLQFHSSVRSVKRKQLLLVTPASQK